MSLPVDVSAARLKVTLHVFAHDKKARAGARWLISAANEAGVEPRIGQVTFAKVLHSSTSITASTMLEQGEAEGAHPEAPPRKKPRKKKTGLQARLRALPEYYDCEVLEGEPVEMVYPELPGEPPLEPDLSALLLPRAVSARSYATAARSPLATARDNAIAARNFVTAMKYAGEPGYEYRRGEHGTGHYTIVAVPGDARAKRGSPPKPGDAREKRTSPPKPPKAMQQPPRQPQPTAEELRQFVHASLADNGWDADLRSRMLRFDAASGPSFKVQVPRTSRAGCNDELTAVQVVARLSDIRRKHAIYSGGQWAEWRREKLQWLLGPRPLFGAFERLAGLP